MLLSYMIAGFLASVILQHVCHLLQLNLKNIFKLICLGFVLLMVDRSTSIMHIRV